LWKFLQAGEAQHYHGVTVTYERGHSNAVLYVYQDDGTLLETIDLLPIRTLPAMRELLEQHHFIKKSDEELQLEHRRWTQGTTIRKQRSSHQWERHEYQRQQQVHAERFRRDVMTTSMEDEMTWAGGKDWLCINYHRIVRGAIRRNDVKDAAERYLFKHSNNNNNSTVGG